MQQQEKRGASRVACRVPLRVLRPPTWPPVSVEDVSATGLRLKVSVRHVAGGCAESLEQVARALEEAFRSDLQVEFDPDRLGSLVRHRVRIVRMGPLVDEREAMELGGVLEPPLSEQEAAAMELVLPEAGEFRAERETGPCTGWRALVVPRGRPGVLAFLADVRRVDEAGVTVEVGNRHPAAAGGIASVLVGLLETYGSRLVMQVADGPRHVWTRDVRLTSLEALGKSGSTLSLSFAFSEPSGAALDVS
jgi:hypothetical protein